MRHLAGLACSILALVYGLPAQGASIALDLETLVGSYSVDAPPQDVQRWDLGNDLIFMDGAARIELDSVTMTLRGTVTFPEAVDGTLLPAVGNAGLWGSPFPTGGSGGVSALRLETTAYPGYSFAPDGSFSLVKEVAFSFPIGPTVDASMKFFADTGLGSGCPQPCNLAAPGLVQLREVQYVLHGSASPIPEPTSVLLFAVGALIVRTARSGHGGGTKPRSEVRRPAPGAPFPGRARSGA